MAEIPEAVYEAADAATADADCAHGCHCEYRRCQYPCRSCVARAAVDAVAPLLIAEGRRQAARQIIARDEAEGDWDVNVAYWAAVRIAEGTDA